MKTFLLLIATLSLNLAACSAQHSLSDGALNLKQSAPAASSPDSLFDQVMAAKGETEAEQTQNRAHEAAKQFLTTAADWQVTQNLLMNFDSKLDQLYHQKTHAPKTATPSQSTEVALSTVSLEESHHELRSAWQFREENLSKVEVLYQRLLEEANTAGGRYEKASSLALDEISQWLQQNWRSAHRYDVLTLTEQLQPVNQAFLQGNPGAKVVDFSPYAAVPEGELSVAYQEQVQNMQQHELLQMDPLVDQQWQTLRIQTAAAEIRSRYVFTDAHDAFYPNASRSGTLDGTEMSHGNWAITIDDGPHPIHTRELINEISSAGHRATFFWLSENIKRYPAIVAFAGQAGFRRGSHSFTHPNLQKLGEEGLTHEIDDANRVFTSIVGAQPTFFRCPYGNCGKVGSRIRQKVAALHMMNVLWNIDSLDWQDKNPVSIFNRVKKQMELDGRGIILFHDIHAQTVPAMKLLVDYINTHPEWKTYTMDEVMAQKTGHEYPSP